MNGREPEFKETWDAAASLKSICAFANDLDNWGECDILSPVVRDNNGRPVFPLKRVPTEELIFIGSNSIFAKCKHRRPVALPRLLVR